jgi:integrase
MRVERAAAPSRANHEKALLSNLFFHGIDLGLCADNPARLVRPNVEEPRTQAPEPALLAAFVAWAMQQTPQRRIVTPAARYASLGGSRKAEFLDLAWPQVDREAGQIRTKRAKQRGKKRGEVIDVVTISPALGQVLDELATLRRPDCLYVFPTRDGNAYPERAFKTLWQRLMMAAIAEGVLTPAQRFTFHDLRAFYATEHKRQRGALPDLHKNPATTAGIYDRNREVKRSAI